MKILISCRSYYHKNYKELRDCVDQRLISWVVCLGYVPVLVPNIFGHKKNFNDLKKFLSEIKPHGLIISGGEDFGVKKKRDILEKKLIDYFLKKKKPILGICRGFQLISKLFGSKITKAKEEVRKKYKITIKEKIPQILNAKCYFNYTINKIPKGFKLIAENKINMKITPWMIKSNNQICECWMIHPEREKIFNKILLKRAKNLFKKK